MVKLSSKNALIFLIGGSLVLCALGFFVALGNALGAAGDGISGGRTTAGVILVPYASYFICGIVASLVAKRMVRKVLAIFGHIASFALLLFEWDRDSVAFSLIVNAVLFVVFGPVWRELLRKSEKDADITDIKH